MLLQRSNSRFLSVVMQVLMWLVFYVSFLLYQPSDIVLPYQLWIKQLIFAGLVAGAYYLNALVLVPRFLLTNKIAAYFGFVITIVIVILIVNALADNLLGLHRLMDEAFHHSAGPRKHENHSIFDAIFGSFLIALILGISTSVTATQKWQTDQQHNQLLREEKTSSELAFLKAQINPHFFFNTLNNIYALTYEDAETSRKAILELSRMMRYLLYDTKKDYTQLSDELNFLKGYVELMRLRLTNLTTVDFQYPASVLNTSVAPMLFLPFVENAFKYGVSVIEPSEILIHVELKAQALNLLVINNIVQTQTTAADEYSGIGLENTRRRLELLYPGKYSLNVQEASGAKTYTINLTIDLS